MTTPRSPIDNPATLTANRRTGTASDVVEVLELLRLLSIRPRRGELPDSEMVTLPRGRWGLPLVYLVRPAGAPVLKELAEYLGDARPNRVPHVLVSCERARSARLTPEAEPEESPEERRTAQITAILSDLAREFRAARNGHQGRLTFERFRFVEWLLSQNLGASDEEADRVLLRRLRQRAVARRTFGGGDSPGAMAAEAADGGPAWLRLLARLVPLAWFRLQVSGRVPLVGGLYRWFLRQRFFAPGDPGTFVGFAERLTRPGRAEESHEEIRRLLVNAFLEDLRAAYRRRLWRPRGARRTAYPVALLDHAAHDNGGLLLLELISDVRVANGSFDPLLAIGAGEEPPGLSGAPVDLRGVMQQWPASQARTGYRAWCREFAAASRSRKTTAWYLPIRVESVTPDPAIVGPAALDPVKPARTLDAVPRLTVPPAPRWARLSHRLLAAGMALALVGGSLWAARYQRHGAEQRAIDRVNTEEQAWRDEHCGQPRSVPGADLLHTAPDGTCYGISDGRYVFGTDDAMHRVHRVIHEQNKASKPGRPVVVLAYISALEGASPTNAREVLAGVAARQREYNDNPSSRAHLEVLIGNAGARMQYGSVIAGDLAMLAKRDPRFVGVLGLSQSREPTVRTITALGAAGLPMVASALSADTLVGLTPMYFQVSPQNRWEAAISATYLDRVLVRDRGLSREVVIVQSNDADDTYNNNLADDVEISVRRLRGGYTVTRAYYAADPQPEHTVPAHAQPASDLGTQLCPVKGLVFFAGRPEDFNAFLGGVRKRCASAPPAILGGDDISRFVAEPRSRTRHGVAFEYLSFAVGKTECSGAGLYQNLRSILPEMCAAGGRDPSLDGHAALAYDGTSVMLNAIDALFRRGIPVTPGAVWHQLSTTKGANTIEGETGTLDFNGTPDGQYMTDKAIAVMAIDPAGRPRHVGICGRTAIGAPAAWCP